MLRITGLVCLVCIGALCGTLVLASCGRSVPGTHGPDYTALPQLGQPFQLGLGASMTVDQATVTFRSVTHDSRCPSELDCEEEGLVRATVALKIAGIPHGDVSLALFGTDRETRRSQTLGGGYIVRLVGMAPYPAQARTETGDRYVATFVVEQASQQVLSTYQLISTPAYEGVIVPENDGKAADAQAAAYWTPSDEDIAELESSLAPFLQQAAPPRSQDLWQRQATYKRQYTGLVRNGQRLIHANFLCDDMQGRWKTAYQVVLDGGDCFFQVTYDPAMQRFSTLTINGEA